MRSTATSGRTSSPPTRRTRTRTRAAARPAVPAVSACVSGGGVAWRVGRRAFWAALSPVVAGASDLSITEVIDALDRDLGPHFSPTDPANPDKDPRGCPACGAGRLGLRLGRNGGFIGCSNYPDCRYTRPLAVPGNEEDHGVDLTNPKVLDRKSTRLNPSH